jgi:hypothetical protein
VVQEYLKNTLGQSLLLLLKVVGLSRHIESVPELWENLILTEAERWK